MKLSNLAQRLEEFEATIESLRLEEAPATGPIAPRDDLFDQVIRRARRPRLARFAPLDDGLRPFRVF